MNFMLRIALQLLAAFVFLLICIQVIILGVAWLFWPDLIRTGNTSNHYEIFVVALCSVLFVVTLPLDRLVSRKAALHHDRLDQELG